MDLFRFHLPMRGTPTSYRLLVDPNSSAIVAAFRACRMVPASGFWQRFRRRIGIPYVVVDSTATPTVPINVIDSASQSDVVVAPFPDYRSHRRQSQPIARAGRIQTMAMLMCWCWTARNANSTRRTTRIAAMGNGMLRARRFGTCTTTSRAPGAGLRRMPRDWRYFPGLVRYDEIASGAINHALRFTLEQTKNDANGGYFVSPATHAAGNDSGTNNVIGMRIRLKSSFDISGFSPVNQIILTAMQQYGLILGRQWRQTSISRARPILVWTTMILANLEQIASSNFEVVQSTPELPGYDSATAPKGAAPAINSFTPRRQALAQGIPLP